jgi:hypothetical protein
MNRTLFHMLVVILSFTLCPLFAELRSSIDVRAAAFFPSSKRFREIYGTVGPSYQLEASTQLPKYLDAWMNFDWFSQHGKSIGFHNPTRVSIANLSFGIKFPYQFSNHFTVYAGIGPSFAKIWVKNKSQCGDENISRFPIGGVIKTGIYCLINQRIFMDVFVDYLYQPAPFKTNVDVGGTKTGLGIGVKF